MDNQEKYRLLSEGETGLPSNIGVFPLREGFKFTEEMMKKSLESGKDFQLIGFKTVTKEDESSPVLMEFDIDVKCEDEDFNLILSVVSGSQIELDHFGFGNQVEEDEMRAAVSQPYFLETSMFFGEDSLSSFHLQLKILHTIVPEASVIVDFMPARLLSGQWLKMTAESSIPPSPDYLYIVHSVYSGEGEDMRYWLHTHGLHRCGSVELEMINIKQGAQQMYDMLNVAAKMFINGNATKENEKFSVGYDGMGISLCWVQWEDAIKHVPHDAPGGAGDREGEGNIHMEPSGVLFGIEDDILVSPEMYATSLADNPLYFISNSETVRMSLLAKERFPLFKEIFSQMNRKKSWNPFAKKNQDKDWRFLVKLGLTVDNAEQESDKEHLWFDVLSLEGNEIHAELINQPYWISGLKAGDKKKFPLDVLTDWIIYAPDATYTTDSVYQYKN